MKKGNSQNTISAKKFVKRPFAFSLLNVWSIQGNLRVICSRRVKKSHQIFSDFQNVVICCRGLQEKAPYRHDTAPAPYRREKKTSVCYQKKAGEIQGNLRAICSRRVKKYHQIFSDFQTVVIRHLLSWFTNAQEKAPYLVKSFLDSCQKNSRAVSSFIVVVYERKRKIQGSHRAVSSCIRC